MAGSNCTQCGAELSVEAVAAGREVCPQCKPLRILKHPISPEERTAFLANNPIERAGVQRENDSVKLTTADRLEGFQILRTIEIVGAECVAGKGPWTEFLAGLSDLIDGRSKELQGVLRDSREICLSDLRSTARTIGANAVIGVRLTYEEVGGKDCSILMVVATGTAVVVKPDDSRPHE